MKNKNLLTFLCETLEKSETFQRVRYEITSADDKWCRCKVLCDDMAFDMHIYKETRDIYTSIVFDKTEKRTSYPYFQIKDAINLFDMCKLLYKKGVLINEE